MKRFLICYTMLLYATCIAACQREPRKQQTVRHLTAFLHANREVLDGHVAKVRDGSVAVIPGFITYPVPDVTTVEGVRLISVSRDSNGNVYFITSKSHVAFNVGLIARAPAAEIIGDGQEPRMSDVSPLVDEWWIYTSE